MYQSTVQYTQVAQCVVCSSLACEMCEYNSLHTQSCQITHLLTTIQNIMCNNKDIFNCVSRFIYLILNILIYVLMLFIKLHNILQNHHTYRDIQIYIKCDITCRDIQPRHVKNVHMNYTHHVYQKQGCILVPKCFAPPILRQLFRSKNKNF